MRLSLASVLASFGTSFYRAQKCVRQDLLTPGYRLLHNIEKCRKSPLLGLAPSILKIPRFEFTSFLTRMRAASNQNLYIPARTTLAWTQFWATQALTWTALSLLYLYPIDTS